MDLRETIISSFFFHLVLFLLMLGLANFRAGFSGSLPDVISVDLTTENSNIPPATTAAVAKPAPPSSAPAVEETKPPDQAKVNPPEDSKKNPAPEDKPATAADAPKIEIPGKLPEQSRGSDSREAYYQFLTLHRKIFAQKAGATINELIGKALKVNTREFYGGTAVVSLTYGSEGELDKVDVDSASPDLKAFLEEVGWYDVPAPPAYIGHTVQIDLTVLEGAMSYRVTIL
jgi:hypothetical protein